MSRRAFLEWCAVASFATLTGCACPPKYLSSQVNLSEFIPLISDSVDKLGSQIPVIDAHAHIFNASDLQASGYLSGPVANEYKQWRKLIKLLVPFIDFASKVIAPSALAEIEKLKWLSKDSTQDSFDALLTKEIDKQNELISDSLIEKLSDKFWVEYSSLADQFSIGGKSPYGQILSASDKRVELDRVIGHYGISLNEYLDSFNDSIMNKHPSGLLAFVFFMLSLRSANLARYQNAFTCKINQSNQEKKLNTVACVVALVDFNYWLGKCNRTYSSMEDQIQLMALIAKISNGYVLPVVAYNPLVDVNEKVQLSDGTQEGRSLHLVKKAINEFGFVGTKIYPTIGYSAAGGESDFCKLARDDINFIEVDKALTTFYQTISELDVPVMAHANYSLGTNDQCIHGTSPSAWRELISKRKLPMRINVGHFGEGSKPPGELKDWTTALSDLILDRSDIPLYGDLGYWQNIHTNEYLLNMLTSNMGRHNNQNLKVIDRVMYGTDWLMLSKEGDWSKYLSNWKKALDKKSFSEKEQAQIFYTNVLKLYGLDGTGKNHKRLTKFYRKNSIKPRWINL